MNRVPEYSHLIFIIPVYLRTITLSKSLVIVHCRCSWTNKKKVQLSWTNKKSSCSDLGRQLPLCNTSSEAGALPSEVRIENDSDRKFSKSIFFQSFSGNHFLPVSLLAENIFSVFRSPHLPLDTLIKKSSYSWTYQKVQL